MKLLFVLLTVFESFLAALSQHTLQSDLRVTVTAEASQPITYAGSLCMQGERFRVAMLGLTAAFDGTTLYLYQSETEELTVSDPSADELMQTNPLCFVRAALPLCHTTERSARNGAETVITFTPKEMASAAQPAVLPDGFRSLTLCVRNADMMPLSVEMREKKHTTSLSFLAPRYLTAGEPVQSFVLTQEDFPDAYINDLR